MTILLFRGRDQPLSASETPKRTPAKVIAAELPKARQRAAAKIARGLPVNVSENMVRAILKTVNVAQQ